MAFRRLENWQRATLLLCLYGFFKEMKPSEPFLTAYLKGPPKNLTEEQLDNEVYPVWTYSYLVALLFVFLLTDFLRYKPVIIIESFAYLATRALLIWATGVLAMQFMQIMYGVATGTEIAYYSYIYAVVETEHFRKVTSYTRAAVLVGRLMSGVVGQLLISLQVTGYLELNYISMGSVCIAIILSMLLPSASGNVLGVGGRETSQQSSLVEESHKNHDNHGDSNLGDSNHRDGNQEHSCQGSNRETSQQSSLVEESHQNHDNYGDSNLGDSNHGNGNQEHSCQDGNIHGYKPLEPTKSRCASCFRSWKLSLLLIWHDLKECYSNKELLKWSLWWAFGTCGEFQVENYVYNLWDIIYPSHIHKHIYNGGVTALSHVFCTSIALFLGYWKINWSIFGELCLGIVSVSDALVLYISAATSSIWLAYAMYLLFRTAYTFLIVVASFQIAQNVPMVRYALVFGCNMFVSLLLQTILTSIVVDERGLGLDVRTQFVVYGSYFYILGAVFMGKGVYTMTRIGWRNCWQQRHVQEDLHVLIDQTTDELNTRQSPINTGEPQDGNGIV